MGKKEFLKSDIYNIKSYMCMVAIWAFEAVTEILTQKKHLLYEDHSDLTS